MKGNRILKAGLWIIITLLIVLTIVLLVAGGFGPLFIVGTGILLIYNLAILFALRSLQKKEQTNPLLFQFLWILFLIPIVWALIDFEGMVNFLLQGVHLDMK